MNLDHGIPESTHAEHLRSRLVEAALEWQRTFGVAPVSIRKLFANDRRLFANNFRIDRNLHMHAVSNELRYKDAQGSLAINSLDAPLVALGARSPIYFSDEQPDIRNGIHVCLFNNGWGTNYIQWFGEDMRFRFSLNAT